MGDTYDKLVRDRIPELIEADGKRPITRVVDDETYGDRLAEKLCEEADEYRESGSLEELADVLEVLEAIIEHRGIANDDLEARRREKRRERGGFRDRILLERVEEPDRDRPAEREGERGANLSESDCA